MNLPHQVELDPMGSGAFKPCITSTVSLPVGYFFGVSAATGGLADNHDLFLFETTTPDNQQVCAACAGACVHACEHVCIRTYACACACACSCSCSCSCVCMSVCVRACMYV